MTELDLKNMRSSKLVELLFEIYRGIFSSGESEEDALFSKALVDFNRRALVSTLELGMHENTVPILNVSLWQSILSGDGNLFKIRIETAGGVPEMTESMTILVEEIQNAINKWGERSLGGIISINDKNINPDGVSWVITEDKDGKK